MRFGFVFVTTATILASSVFAQFSPKDFGDIEFKEISEFDFKNVNLGPKYGLESDIDHPSMKFGPLPSPFITGDLMPSFVKELNPTQVQEFLYIALDVKESKGNIERKIGAWVSKQSEELQKDFKLMKAKEALRKDKFQKFHNSVASRFFPDASDLDNKIMNLLQNDDITKLEQTLTIRQLMKNSNCNTLRQLMPLYPFVRAESYRCMRRRLPVKVDLFITKIGNGMNKEIMPVETKNIVDKIAVPESPLVPEEPKIEKIEIEEAKNILETPGSESPLGETSQQRMQTPLPLTSPVLKRKTRQFEDDESGEESKELNENRGEDTKNPFDREDRRPFDRNNRRESSDLEDRISDREGRKPFDHANRRPFAFKRILQGPLNMQESFFSQGPFASNFIGKINTNDRSSPRHPFSPQFLGRINESLMTPIQFVQIPMLPFGGPMPLNSQMPPHMPFGRPMMPQSPFNGPMSNNGPMSPIPFGGPMSPIPFGRPMPPMPFGRPMPPMPFGRPMPPAMPFMPFGRPMPNNGPMAETKITIPNIPTPSKVIAPEEDKNVIVIEKPNIDTDKKDDEDRLPTPPPYNNEKKFEMQNDFEGRNDRVNFFKLPALFLTREKIREYRKRSDGFEPSNREEFGNNRQSRFPFSKQMKRYNRRNNEQQDMRRDFNRNSFQARDNFGKFNNNNMKPQFDAPNFGDVLPILRERVY